MEILGVGFGGESPDLVERLQERYGRADVVGVFPDAVLERGLDRVVALAVQFGFEILAVAEADVPPGSKVGLTSPKKVA